MVSNANNLDTSSNFVNTLAAELVVNGVSSVMAEEMAGSSGKLKVYPDVLPTVTVANKGLIRILHLVI